MKKRYAITMEEETHRALQITALRSGKSVGQVIGGLIGPEYVEARFTGHEEVKVASVDKPVVKAIEPERVKVDQGGTLRKGLGDLPGEDKPVVPGQGIAGGAWREFRPAPKPGKKR